MHSYILSGSETARHDGPPFAVVSLFRGTPDLCSSMLGTVGTHTQKLSAKKARKQRPSIEYGHSSDSQSDELAKAEKENSYDY